MNLSNQAVRTVARSYCIHREFAIGFQIGQGLDVVLVGPVILVAHQTVLIL